MAGMLYYPAMTPPGQLLFQSVLYWDFLSTIVPEGYRSHLGETMLRLEDAGLYRPVHMTDPVYADLPYQVLNALEALPRTRLDELLPARGAPRDEARHGLPPLDLDFIHPGKFFSAFNEVLVRRGLAVRGARGLLIVAAVVYRVLFAVAAEQVAAKAAASHDAGPLFTHTDDERHFWAAHEPRYRLGGPFPPPRTSRCWQADIGALLPVPAPGTPITSVLEFRARYDDERRRLIRAVGRLQHELRQWNDDPREVMSALRDELADAVGDLRQAGKAAKLTWVCRGVYVFIAFGLATATGLGDAAGLGPAAFAATTAALGVGGGLAVNLATNQIAEPNPRSQQFAYLHHAEQTFRQA